MKKVVNIKTPGTYKWATAYYDGFKNGIIVEVQSGWGGFNCRVKLPNGSHIYMTCTDLDDVKEEEEVKKDSDKFLAAQKSWIEFTNIKVGAMVSLSRLPESYDNGWTCCWPSECVNIDLSKVYEVTSISDRRGICIKHCKDDDVYVPFHVVNIIDNTPAPDPVKLDSGEYEVTFRVDGSIEVGCQTISFETLERIYNTAKKAKR